MRLEPGAVLSDLDLSRADFTDLDLTDAVFERCAIVDATITGACLDGARFSNCRIVRCRFADTDLRRTRFEDCVFADDRDHTGVAFAFSRLEEACFADCDLSFATFERSDLHGLEATGCNLRGARFTDVDFSRLLGRKIVKWAGAFRDCNLEFADLGAIRMPGCAIRDTRLREAVLVGADFEGADLRGCDFFQATTAGATFTRADLRGADLCGMNPVEWAGFRGMKISSDHAHQLLVAMGVEVHPD
ncbi:pentapeptide repeat-containing protein [Pinisolibacter aquiterrae]|uniref:pentapeptide repeat-containing protein n=1 Tax=Pinisolibacter aquiterrae TaxID=2815579 RepID=UPI001C3E46B1|nr:pentapeptide repeat-containing protein [Pinisolibacter aquiterrae]MBV5265266.1 pentapeptide repeat-containing protein [Pinisolibacter aquiterrae]MCC8235405.1 pentapeptide repeat-containing protein [Pinisolibacter aquiterrae]